MKSVWLNKQNNKNLIVFFNGWANDENHLKRLYCIGFDVVVLYDYKNLDFDFSQINSYEKQYVIAWSMGVWAFSQVRENLENTVFKMAVNGTIKPIDDEFGIPFDIFDATLKNFSQITREKFYKRMFVSKDEFAKYLKIQPKRSVENQKEELDALKKQILRNKSKETNFDKVIISKKDFIIPVKNQENFYCGFKGDKVLKAGGHYPFFGWNSFEEIIYENT